MTGRKGDVSGFLKNGKTIVSGETILCVLREWHSRVPYEPKNNFSF